MRGNAVNSLRSVLASATLNASDVLTYLSRRLYQSRQSKRTVQWFRDNGDRTLRLNHDLRESSLVIDVGGYDGQWASDVFSKYCCTIHVFEPVPEFADQIKRRFSRNSKILVHRLGLSNETNKAMIGLAQDSSSLFKQGVRTTEIALAKASDVLRDNGIHNIDLMNINIEGSEYEVIEDLVASGYIRFIMNLQVQFHDFVPNAEDRMQKLHRSLADTHHLTWQYPFVWENWRRKDNVS